jgi:hypothetical protein
MIVDEVDTNRFLMARDGDHLVTSFQCDQCHFVNLFGRLPISGLGSDIRVLKCIRRANLDAFWSREPSTVKRVLQEVKRGLAIASSLGFAHSLFRPMGPFPVEDNMGMGIAIVLLQRSLDKGKYDKTVQFETIRKFRSAASNVFHASVEGQGAMTMAKDSRKLMVTTCPTYGDYFERFMRGMHKRMGDVVRPDRALSLPIMLELVQLVEQDWLTAPTTKKLKLALEGTFYTLAYTLALRGEEVPLIELHGLRSHWEKGLRHERPHVVISLLGRFKNEIGEAYHLMPVLAETPGGFQPQKWVKRVIDGYWEQGVTRGYIFRNKDHTKLKCSSLEPKFHSRLEKLKQEHPDLISEETDVAEEYGLSRSFRRGATSEATNRGASSETIELIGRWRKSHQKGPGRPNVTIREHYTDIRLTINRFLEFSQHL